MNPLQSKIENEYFLINKDGNKIVMEEAYNIIGQNMLSIIADNMFNNPCRRI